MLDKSLNLRWWGICAPLATALLFTFSFPLHQVSQFAYFFAVPFLVWGYNCPSKKKIFWSALVAGSIGWFFTIYYLRHVSVILPFAAGAYGGLYLGIWLFVASFVLKKVIKENALLRLVALLGLAGFWVILEWIRGWLFSGYPWLPLAASQWKSPVLLQFLQWTGAYGLSFVLIFFNLAVATFIIGLCRAVKLGSAVYKTPSGRWIEGYLSTIFLLIGIIIFFKTLPQKENQELAFRAGFVQPNIPANLKWDQQFFWNNLKTLQEETLKTQSLDPDLVIWPECAIPSALNSDENMRYWVERLVNGVNVPFLVGALAKEENNHWYNAIVEIRPMFGLSSIYYAKQKRVPFGEYVPLRKWLPFINKVVPLDFDLTPGTFKEPLNIEIKNRLWKIGGLVCYEDIFSWLARDSVQRGGEFLLVVTNDAWYHEEGGAYQHAANSVLRAAEVRRPVLRCGNNGWSGWIDEYGNIRNVLLDDTGSIYFRGSDVFPIYRDVSWSGKLTFFVRHGDWFVVLCGFLVVGGIMVLIMRKGNEI